MQLFKPHILATQPYRGGSTREETAVQNQFYKLSSNENILGPSPMAVEAIRNNLHLLHEYSFQNDERFREALAEHVNDSLLPEQFVTANSGMELLDLICRAFMEPGHECILSSPTFMAYHSFGTVQGAKVIDVPLKTKDFSIDAEAILDAMNENTRILFLTNPNNPTGTYIPKKLTNYLIDQLPSHVVVIYDEVYHDFVEAKDYARAIDYIKKRKNVIGMHSFSKAYGLAGIRLGYAFASKEIAAYLQRLRRPFMINTLSMEAGIAALKDKSFLSRTKELVAQEKEWLYTQFDLFRIDYGRSEANFILFQSPIYATYLAEELLHRGVMVRTGDVFKAPDCIRVTVGTHDANLAFINALESVMEAIPVVNAHE